MTDPSARGADADELAVGLFVVRGEHHAEGGEDDVEGAGFEGELFGVGDHELDLGAFGCGSFGGALEQRGDEVRTDDVGSSAGRGEGGVAVAAGDVEHALIRAHVRGLTKGLAHDLQRGTDDREVPRGPDGLHPRLHGVQGRQGGTERSCG